VGGRQQPKGDFQPEGYLMFNSFRYFGLVASSVVAATVASTGASYADVKKIQTKFINKLPVEVIVTFEGTGVGTGPWHAKPNENKNFLLIPEGITVTWKVIPAIVAGSTFDSCTGAQKIGSGNAGDTIVLNRDHCVGSGSSAKSAGSGSGSGSASVAPKPGSGSGSSGGLKTGSGDGGQVYFSVPVKNDGTIPIRVTVSFNVPHDGTSSDTDRDTGLIQPGQTGTATQEYTRGNLQPTAIYWKAERQDGRECNGRDRGTFKLPIVASCSPPPPR
jgi:hypothetical protein